MSHHTGPRPQEKGASYPFIFERNLGDLTWLSDRARSAGVNSVFLIDYTTLNAKLPAETFEVYKPK